MPTLKQMHRETLAMYEKQRAHPDQRKANPEYAALKAKCDHRRSLERGLELLEGSGLVPTGSDYKDPHTIELELPSIIYVIAETDRQRAINLAHEYLLNTAPEAQP